MATTTDRTATDADRFTAEERAAMKEHARELRAAKKREGAADKIQQEEQAVLDKIAELPDDERPLAQRIHRLVKENAPALTGKLWYGMPAWAKDGTIICFFQPASKFRARYATLGFNDGALLDDGNVWATSFAVKTLNSTDEARLSDVLRRAAG